MLGARPAGGRWRWAVTVALVWLAALGAPSRADAGDQIELATPGIVEGNNDNRDALARHIQAISRAGGLDAAVARELIAIESGDNARILDSLGAEVAVDNLISTLLGSLRFSDSLHSCADPGVDTYRFVRQGECLWSRFQAQSLRQGETHDTVGFRDEWLQLAVGGQVGVAEDWSVGGALSWESHRLRSNGAGTSDGDQFHAGVAVKRSFDALLLSATLAGGYANYDLRRRPAIGEVARGDQAVWSAASHLRAAYQLGGEEGYVTPRIDLGVQWLSMTGFHERGGSPFALRVQSQNDTYFTVQPALEMGAEFEVGRLRIRPRLTLAVTQFIGDAAAEVSATFAATPTGVDPFRTRTHLDRTRFDGALGADVFGIAGIIVHADVFGNVSAHGTGYGGGVKLAIPF